MLVVIHGVLAQLPIADLFVAGIVPGLMLTLFFFIIIALVGLRHQVPKGEWMALRQALGALGAALAAVPVEATRDPFLFLPIVNLALFVVGMVIDGIAALIPVVPLLLPVAVEVHGIHPMQVGLVVCPNLVPGLLTSPVGAGLHIAAAMSGAKPFGIFLSLAPFLAAAVLLLLPLGWFPALTLALT